MTHTGCLLTTIDAEIGKIGPGPSGCGEKAIHASSVNRPWSNNSKAGVNFR